MTAAGVREHGCSRLAHQPACECRVELVARFAVDADDLLLWATMRVLTLVRRCLAESASPAADAGVLEELL